MRKVKSLIKRGKLSAEEKKQIEHLCETKSDGEIGQILKRPENTVQNHRLEYLTKNPQMASRKIENIKIREDLHSNFQWEWIKKQFTSDELIFFEHSYVSLVSQFDSNILPTEQKQLFQAITLEIFMARHNQERVEVQDDITRLKRMVNAIYSDKSPEDMTSAEREWVTGLEGQINALRQSSQSKTKEFKDLSDKFSAILKESKGTREQRIQRAIDSKQKFTDLLRFLEEEEARNRTGIDMVIMEAGVEKEYQRLSELHVYADGEVDPPLLTPENYARLDHATTT